MERGAKTMIHVLMFISIRRGTAMRGPQSSTPQRNFTSHRGLDSETTSHPPTPPPARLNPTGLIALGAAKFHRTALVKETLAQHSIILPLIPGGTIGLSDSWGPCSTWPSSPGTAASESRANTKRPPTEWACPRWVSSAQHDSESSRQRAALHRPKRC